MKLGIYDRDDSLISVVNECCNDIECDMMEALNDTTAYDLIAVNTNYLNDYNRLKVIVDKTPYVILVVEDIDHLDELFQYHIAMITRPYKKEYVELMMNRFYGRLCASIVVTNRGSLNSQLRIQLNDIYYMTSDKRIIKFYGKDNVYLGRTYKKIKDMEKVLPPNFHRTHQSFIVNEDYINKETSNDVYLNTIAQPIPISKARKKRKKITSF